jgi:ATP-dependent Clp protease ATP-binding subunit ClpC
MPSLRVYFITHHNGFLTGRLMRTWRFFFESDPPSAYGRTEAEVLNLLQQDLEDRLAQNKDDLSRYTWDESFEARRILVHVNPQTTIQKRPVIAKQEVPILLTYIYSKLPGGAVRLLLPRFEWSLIIEDLSIAESSLRQAVSSALLGEHAKWLFDFRHEGPEFVREWSPNIAPASSHDDDPQHPANATTLSAVADEWVARAARRKLPPVVGPAPTSIQEARAWILASRAPQPPSLLIVGPPGVGKTTWVRSLAFHINHWQRADSSLAFPRVWSTSADRIIAGQIYLGMWQQRCIQLLRELQYEGDYLYIDHVLPFFQDQPGGGSISDILLPALYNGHISLIAECTPSSFEHLQRLHPDIINLFKIIRLSPPSTLDMPPLLQAYQSKRAHAPAITSAALQRLVRHLDHFQRHISFPGKGFLFLDWLNKTSSTSSLTPPASPALSDSDKAPPLTAPLVTSPKVKLSPNAISEAFSRFSGLPLELISDAHIADAPHICASLRARVIGQDAATLTVAEVIARFKAGLNDPNRPCASLLFVGPTGVGKTELAKQTAAYMFGSPDRLIRLDMSEFMSPGSAQRLLSPAQGRSLPERLRQQPLSLLLLDEIEKAHPDVFDLLLAILGEGRLTDSTGHLVDLRMSFIILTSNLGVQTTAPPALSPPPASAYSDRFTHAVRQHFRPELFNRIDHIISFQPLSPDHIAQIVRLDLAALPNRPGLLRRHLRLSICPSLHTWLSTYGYHPTRGARPLKRLIEEHIISPLSVHLSEHPNLTHCTLLLRSPSSPPPPPNTPSITIPTPTIRAT